MKPKNINAILANLFILFAVFFIPIQTGADFTVLPFGYVTIVNENIGGENDFEFALQRKNSSGIFEFTGKSISTDPDSDNYIEYSKFYLAVSNPGEEYRIIEFPPADNWISVSVSCVSDNPGTEFLAYPNGIEIHPAYNQDSFITCTFSNTNSVANTKTPVLFVPGLLGTEIKKGDDLIWFHNDIINPFNSDNFLDALIFKNTLIPNENNLSLLNVIGKKDFPVFDFDYTEGLANEFKNQGYVADDGATGQNFFTFPYDWRYGVSGAYPIPENTSQIPQTNSDLLKNKINQILAQTSADKVDIVAHSMGGLIVKKYAMDNADPKIGKLVFVGVPNLGSIDAAKTLLIGNNFKITGLNDKEIYKISQNMPAAYDLLPSQTYFFGKESYITDLNHFPFGSKLDYAQVNSLFKQTGLNSQGLDNAAKIHTPEFDGYDVRSKNIDTYNIVGCKSPTLAGVNYLVTDEGSGGYSIWRNPISGDDTVPRESAESIPANPEKTFYAIAPEHGKMPSAAGIRQKIVNNVFTLSVLPQGTT
ncbi:MAG: alpha/beta fold hydrolase [Candidatus Nealsonbacteria bacterium DGGOD1a]|jgi:hypothetical protein|nr:MAG: alpha/beta fold hydrolase [Candidatus Nealsonbacteria bacterium DGGOD1a]